VNATRADALVLFGATGDLARKKLFPALYHLSAAGRLDVPVMGVASSAWDDAKLAKYAADSVHTTIAHVNTAVLEAVTDRLAMVNGDYRDSTTFEALTRRWKKPARPNRSTTSPSPRRCSQ
jgi:glucose-6-phosphate 1-dehydrogenase